jgi:hypothetical protein
MTQMISRWFSRACALAFVVTAAACGEDAPPANDAEACMQLEGGAFTTVTAVVARDSTTPTVTADTAYTATLPASGIGYVRFEASSASYVVYLDRDVALIALEGAGTPATISTAKSSEACVTIKARHAFKLGAGTAYLGLGPDAGGPVNVVIKSAN